MEQKRCWIRIGHKLVTGRVSPTNVDGRHTVRADDGRNFAVTHRAYRRKMVSAVPVFMMGD